MLVNPNPPATGGTLAPARPADAVLRSQAQALEAAFLSEMLAHAGLGAAEDGAFGGGIGEQQFASFLRQSQAELMVKRGGIGLAEQLFQAMQGWQSAPAQPAGPADATG